MAKRLTSVRVALALTLAIASAWLLPLAPPANAECFPRPDASTPFDIDWAFIATVRSVSLVHDDEVEAAGEGDGYQWTDVLVVGRVIDGATEGPLTWRGHTLSHLSCNTDLLGEELDVGDRLFIAGEDWLDGQTPAPYGRLLVWRRVDGAWLFDESLLRNSRQADNAYPDSARGTHTTTELLALLAAMPDTATSDAPTSGEAGNELRALMSIVEILVAGSWYLGRRGAPRWRG